MKTQDDKPIIAVSNGDPAGIGPEIVLKALADAEVRAACAPVIIGSPELYERELPLAGKPLTVRTIAGLAQATGDAGVVEILPFDSLDLSQCPRGKVSAEGGRYSGHSIAKAIELAMRGEAHAVIVAPNNKRAMRDGGHTHTGFEEIARHYTGASRSIQILLGNKYTLARVTNHVPLREVSALCTKERVLSAISMLHESLAVIGREAPVIGVSGLNPHNGEEGLMGDEEVLHIGPACDEARALGINVVGPIPADTVFNDVAKYGLDVVLSMYHDHGNSNIKLLEFGHLVNFIGGLPIPVFTVSHGTAYDMAGKGVADATNMRLSILAASRAVRRDAVTA